MKTIYKRYQYYGSKGPVWTEWFKVRDVSDAKLEDTYSQMKKDIDFVASRTHLKQELDVREL